MTQMLMADIFVWLDDAQFSKGSFTNRIQVKLPSGRKWMTIPLQGTGTFLPINRLAAKDNSWIAGHREMLTQSFKGYPHAASALSIFTDVTADRTSLCDMLIAGCESQARAVGWRPSDVLRSSAMGIGGSSWERVLRIVQSVGGTTYLTGHGASSYLDHAAFEQAGVAVRYMDYRTPEWPQSHGAFSPFITGLDLIAAEGPSARKHLEPASLDWKEFQARREAER